MSQKSKSAAKLKRRKMKAGRKAVMKAQYAAWTADGLNNKSDRAKRATARKEMVKTVKHPTQFCGNVGCAQCFPAMSHHVKAAAEKARTLAARKRKANERTASILAHKEAHG